MNETTIREKRENVMKKLTALILAALLVFALAACGNENQPAQGGDQTDIFGWNRGSEEGSSSSGSGNGGSTLFGPSSESSSSSSSSEPAEAPPESSPEQPASSEAPSNDPNNYFESSNTAADPGKVTMRLRYVCWKQDGSLYAECFIINGRDKAVYNLEINELTISSNEAGTIATGSFGDLNGVRIEAGQYAVHAFTFSGAAMVISPGAKLNVGLACRSSITYSYDN